MTSRSIKAIMGFKPYNGYNYPLLPMTDSILIETHDGILSLTMNRPHKKNALTDDMYEQLGQGFALALADSTVRVVFIKGNGADFSSGNDLQDFANWGKAAHFDQIPVIRLIQQIVNFPKPIVAAVRGLAVGFGTTLLFHCDVVVAAKTAKFILPFSQLGVVPEFGCSMLFPLAAGKVRASHYMLLGEPFNGQIAYDMGLVSLLCDDSEVEAQAQARAQALAKLPPQTLQNIKQLINPPAQRAELLQVIAEETRQFAAGLQSAEHQAAIAAFFEMRSKK